MGEHTAQGGFIRTALGKVLYLAANFVLVVVKLALPCPQCYMFLEMMRGKSKNLSI